MFPYKRNSIYYPVWCVGLLACFLLLGACDDVFIYDDEGDCAVTYEVKFKYDYNMKYADAFAHEVAWVTLYLVDSNGHVAWQKSEQGSVLSLDGYVMDVDVDPGQYDLLVWGGTTDMGSFTIPTSTVATELGCTLNRQYANDGTAYVDTDLDRLFHGYLSAQQFPEEPGSYTYTVSLVKDTNVFRVVLQHLTGQSLDKDMFTFAITDDNGSMAWDNSVLADEEITYYAWHTDQGEAGIEETDETESTASPASALTASTASSASALNATAASLTSASAASTRSVYSAAIAELTTARLMTDHATRLVVTNNQTGALVFSIPLIDYALLVKGFYNSGMDDQEYLDRQDEWDMVFFLDDNYTWMDAYIYINSWRVVLQNTGL